MFGGLTDIPSFWSYNDALTYFNDIKPIAGKGVNAGVRPLCNTSNGRRKTQYYIRKKKHPAAASKQAIECVLYDTPVVTFIEDGTIYIDMSYPSNTTHSFVSEILRRYNAHCSYRDGKTWLHCRGEDWWLPHGHGVTFDVVHIGSALGFSLAIEPVRPRLMDRYAVNRSKAKEVYAKYAAFTSHCITVGKLVDPKTIYENRSHWTISSNHVVKELLQTAEPNEEWAHQVNNVLGDAVTVSNDYNIHPFTTMYTLTTKKIRQAIVDKLKHAHAEEIFEVTRAEAGVYTASLNEEYIQ